MKCLTPTWNHDDKHNHYDNDNDNKYDYDSDMLRFNVKAQFVSSKHMLFV